MNIQKRNDDDPDDWWAVFRSYVGEKLWQKFVDNYNYLFKNRTKPSILSAIIHCLGIQAYVSHTAAKQFGEATQAAKSVADACSEQNQLLRENTEALHANRSELFRVHQALEAVRQKIEKATVPWLKITAIALISSILTATVLLNADHLSILRIPNSQDAVIDAERQKNQQLQVEFINLQDKFKRLQNDFNRGDEQAGIEIKKQYAIGYRQALIDIQRQMRGQ